MIKGVLIANRQAVRKFFFLLLDVSSIVLAVFLSFLVRFEGEIPPQYLLNIWGMIGIAVLFSLPIFSFFRLYSFSWA
ncbi:MAG: hypothetical protein HY443_01785, partial [Candidatus Nealsonbacteria bacterium]|nr:hypothetical protein [Candidatus Nealsonbacteria bacterium]